MTNKVITFFDSRQEFKDWLIKEEFSLDKSADKVISGVIEINSLDEYVNSLKCDTMQTCMFNIKESDVRKQNIAIVYIYSKLID